MGLVVTVLIALNTILVNVGVFIEAPRATPPMILRGTVVTMDDDYSVVPNGNVLVVGGRIAAVWGGATPPGVDTAGATVIDGGPGSLIFPGLINIHDHPSYSVLPLFPAPATHLQADRGRINGSEPYANRYQWNENPVSSEYARVVRSAEFLLTDSTMLDLESEAVKRAEVEGLLGGQTTIQGSQPDQAVDMILARNVDNGSFGRDRIESRVGKVTDPGFETSGAASNLRTRMQTGLTEAWLVHAAEGVRDSARRPGDGVSSRAEFNRIRDLALLNDATVIVHGVGLEGDDFQAMRAAPPARATGVGDGLGAKLVWSPLSNMLLYGATANVSEALAAGVTVALGTDWSPSGSSNLLNELKVADTLLRNPDRPAGDPAQAGLNGVSLDRALVAMVTRDAARAVKWNSDVGSIVAGKAADIVVITPPTVTPTGSATASAYRSLIDATERDVRLVMVGGDPLAGDVDLMTRLKPTDHEVVRSTAGGFSKAVDVTDPDIPEGAQTLTQINTALAHGLRSLGGDTPAPGPAAPTRTWSHLKATVSDGTWATRTDAEFATGFLLQRFRTGAMVNLESIELDPLFSEDDRFGFAVLEGTAGAAPAAPMGVYASNVNQALATGNPFGAASFRARWWPSIP